MNLNEFDQFLENHHDIEYKDDEKGIIFRHTVYDKPEEGVHVEFKTLQKITPAELNRVIVNGRNVTWMTRITGYMSKIDGWNKGKLGELKDRYRSGNI